jgi:hypothetical protein
MRGTNVATPTSRATTNKMAMKVWVSLEPDPELELAESFQEKVLATVSRPVTTRIAWTISAAMETSTPELTATAAVMP